MRRHLVLTIVVGLIIIFALIAIQPYIKPRPKKVAAVEVVTNTELRTSIVVRKQFFTWKEIESPDYLTYIKNLRDIQCPETTIHDIIIAEVNQAFAKRRSEEILGPEQQWWRTDGGKAVTEANAVKLAAMESERRALLTTLLGADWEQNDPLSQPLVALNGPILADISPETKKAVEQLIGHYQQLTQTYLSGQRAAGATAVPAELAKLSQQMRGELGKLLTAAQLEEFLLRYSDSAADLRTKLFGITVQPEEFRTLFRIYDPQQQAAQLASVDAATTATQQTSLEKLLENSLNTVLGAERFQAFRINQDPVYRESVSQVEEAGAPPEAVQRLYRIKNAALAEMTRIQNDPTLTPDQKTALLNNIELQTQTATDRILGVNQEPPPAPPLPPVLPANPPIIHSYVPGETLDQIAAQYNVSSISILNANPNLNAGGLVKGTPINIPRPQPAN